MSNKVTYLHHSELFRHLQRLTSFGGVPSKAAARVHEVMGKIYQENPFNGIPVTNHGESRIKYCVKYKIADGYRLITIQNDNFCFFAYCGKHDDADAWLEQNKGLEIVQEGGKYEPIHTSQNITFKAERISTKTDYSRERILDRLDEEYRDKLLDEVPGSMGRSLSDLNTVASDDDIQKIACKLSEINIQNLIYDTMLFLRAGDIESACTRIDLYLGNVTALDKLDADEIIKIQDGQLIKKIKIDSPDYIKWYTKYMQSASYQDWMLFMHPTQESVAFADFNGPAKLSGVSGSGKTCVVVMRARYLAEKKPNLPILIVTLNKSLAQLLTNLLDAACPDRAIRNSIQCKSFFALCQDLLKNFEPENSKLYDEVTWKTHEHIDEVWREFYRCEVNNDSADVFLPLHKSLNLQNIDAEEYIRQELDWIRSAISNRNDYYKVERKGRAIKLNENFRKAMLEGLTAWEEKMRSIGVIDTAGLASALAKHEDKLLPIYSSILVDEVQDFGTLDLQLLNTLVVKGKNDIFLSGDIAQHILPKYQSFKNAGIIVPGARSKQFQKNYRNSREILKAAYSIFRQNLNSEFINESELEILDPKYANFSTPKPAILKANSLEEEIAYAINTAQKHVIDYPEQKACVAIIGFSQYEITKFAKKIGIKSLDGQLGLLQGNLFISDLDQTKGYEFDFMCILNCSKDILPNPSTPKEEFYRDSCRLYVAMTRAKRELYLSYSGEKSAWLDHDSNGEYFEYLSWSDMFYFDSSQQFGVPQKLPNTIQSSKTNVLTFTGKEFIKTKHMRGCSVELQDKVENLITGKAISRGRDRVQWSNIGDAYEDVKREPLAKSLFGEKLWREFVMCIEQAIR